MTTNTLSKALLALSVGGPLAEIADDPEAYFDRRFPATPDDFDAAALIVREMPELNNTKDSANKLLDLFIHHRLSSIAYVRDLVRDHGIERVSLALECLFAAGEHAHRDLRLENGTHSSKNYDPTAGIKELLELFEEINEIDPDFEITPENLAGPMERAGGLKELMRLSGPELTEVLQPEDDSDEEQFPIDDKLVDDPNRIGDEFDDDQADRPRRSLRTTSEW
jgi:hypothetical protein